MNDIMQQHLDTVRKRLEAQGLSALEMQDLHQEKQSELRNAILEVRERLVGEMRVIDNLVTKLQGPAPTPAEMVAQYRAKGKHDIATSLEHSLEIDARRKDIERLQDGIDNGC